MLFGDWQGLGSYDHAAIRFIYGGLVDRVECEGQRPEDCLEKDENGVRSLHKRTYVKWYMGGEICNQDVDCPMVSHGQQCRYNRDQGTKFCSNWDDDEAISGRYNPRQAHSALMTACQTSRSAIVLTQVKHLKKSS